MSPAELVQHYGYLAVAVGTCFEGETVMLAAGVAASAGLLSLPGVVGAGMAGIFVSDTFCFLVGRLLGARLPAWSPALHARAKGVFQLIERRGGALLVTFQFFPGLCTVTPLAFGMSRIPTARFLALDLLGNAVWTLAFLLGGYAGASFFGRLAAGLRGWEPGLGVAVAAAGLAAWRVRSLLARRPI